VSLQGELNRLAGTSGKAAQGVANTLAGTDGKELLGALNTIAGTVGKGIVFVMNRIAQLNDVAGDVGIESEGEPFVSNADPLGSLAGLATGSIIVGGLDTVIIGFSSAFTGKFMPFRDAAGTFY